MVLKYQPALTTQWRLTGKMDTMWREALALEMFNVGVAFEILEEGQPAPPRDGKRHPDISSGM